MCVRLKLCARLMGKTYHLQLTHFALFYNKNQTHNSLTLSQVQLRLFTEQQKTFEKKNLTFRENETKRDGSVTSTDQNKVLLFK